MFKYLCAFAFALSILSSSSQASVPNLQGFYATQDHEVMIKQYHDSIYFKVTSPGGASPKTYTISVGQTGFADAICNWEEQHLQCKSMYGDYLPNVLDVSIKEAEYFLDSDNNLIMQGVGQASNGGPFRTYTNKLTRFSE